QCGFVRENFSLAMILVPSGHEPVARARRGFKAIGEILQGAAALAPMATNPSTSGMGAFALRKSTGHNPTKRGRGVLQT
ncbi:hypothetical protein, partial [Methylocystis sp. SB2]|uniref:hypothetical protein n=1 Tax=Methylocystis sp. (strain SB2) TaxID=743836 RepID=UPI001AEC4939